MHSGEVSVVWIVEVSGVVDVYHGLVGRSRSGGVGGVEQAGDVRSAGGRSVLVLSKHSVFERHSQKHEQETRGGGDGGWRTEGRERTEGRRTHYVYGRVAESAVLGSNAIPFIFHRTPTAMSRLGFLFVILLFSQTFEIRDCGYLFFDFSMPSSDSCNASTRRQLLSRARRYDGLGSPV